VEEDDDYLTCGKCMTEFPIGISILYGGRLEPTFFYSYATAFSSNMNVIYYILPGCKPVVTSCPGSLQSFILCFIKDVIFSRGNSVIHLPV
jgi:hypothetical protein